MTENTQNTDLIREAITEWFGARCPDTEPGCPICDAWAQFDALTPAPQMPEDVADRHSDRRRNVIINHTSTDLENIVNGHDPDIHHLGNRVWDRLDKMAVEIERHAIEAQAAENADLRAKLAEVTALLADAYGAEIDWDALLQERGAGTFAQGIEAAAKEAERVIARFVYFDPTARERDAAFPKAIRALTPPVAARETPIRCHQAGLTSADEQQVPGYVSPSYGIPVELDPQADLETCLNCEGTGISGHPDSGNTCANCNGSGGVAPQADPVREAAQWLLRNVSGKTLREAGYVLTDTSDLDEFLALRALAGES